MENNKSFYFVFILANSNEPEQGRRLRPLHLLLLLWQSLIVSISNK